MPEDNWRAFCTRGLSATSLWEHHLFWQPRKGIDRGRKEFGVDWENLQRPGFSPNYLEARYERMDMAFERSDGILAAGAKALIGKIVAGRGLEKTVASCRFFNPSTGVHTWEAGHSVTETNPQRARLTSQRAYPDESERNT